MKLRLQLIAQTTVYLHQHPAEANLTTEDLRDMIGHLSAQQLMQQLQCYSAKVQGSSQYWYKQYNELHTLIEQKGPPTFFWTVSSAENYRPELHKLMPHSESSKTTDNICVHTVIDNLHITDWFFTSKMSNWVQH